MIWWWPYLDTASFVRGHVAFSFPWRRKRFGIIFSVDWSHWFLGVFERLA